MARAAYDQYLPGTAVTIGEFIYDDNFQATTSDNCSVTVYNPGGSAVVNAQAMSIDANSWHHYTFTPTTTEGTWPAFISCGTSGNGDLVKEDKTFVVTSNIVSSSSVAALVNTNTNSVVSSASSSLGISLTSVASSILSIPLDVWGYSSRTITSFGTLAADVWGAATRTLTGAGLTSGSLATQSDVQSASSSIVSQVSGGSGVTLSDLQAASSSIAAVVNANTNAATAGIISSVNSHTDSALAAASSSIASVVNANTNSVVTAASSSLGSSLASIASSIASLPASVWNVATSTFSTAGTVGYHLVSNLNAAVGSVASGASLTAADVWSYATRTLTGAGLTSGSLATQSDVQSASSSLEAAVNAAAASVNANTNTVVGNASSSIGSAVSSITVSGSGWNVNMSDFSSVLAGGTYRARVTTSKNDSLTAPYSAPSITLYDANRNVVVSGVAMTLLSTGVYEYTYSVSSSASEGTWEAVVSAPVESGKTLQTNDYWDVVSAPAQVLIQSMGTTETPSVTANIRITNEGSVNYEYQYEWCVVSSITNSCGGGDDVYYASAAKLINAGANFDTTLSATVPLAGTYYFKTVAYFGNQSSVSARQFTATSAGGTGGGGTGDGGGGGGGGIAPSVPVQPVLGGAGDLNADGKINGVDFSILLAFWKSSPPFKNASVDLNKDGKVDSVDFSILLFKWGK